jgi:hypothetical protein
MDNANWEIGVSADSLEELLCGEQAGMTLWFLAGYAKGLSDSYAWQQGERLSSTQVDPSFEVQA